MFEHDFQGEVRVVWCEDAESFVATEEAMEGFRGMGGSHADAVADLELGIGIEAAALREERRAEEETPTRRRQRLKEGESTK